MADSFGGIVISGGDKVLLRKPKNNYDGYSWTFSKTTCTLNEAPENSAIRVVKEKAGYEARILAKISGVFYTLDQQTPNGFILEKVRHQIQLPIDKAKTI